MKLHKIRNLATTAALSALLFTPSSLTVAAAASTKPMTPEVKLVDDYNTWFLGGGYQSDATKLQANLPKYITSETVLHEVVSLPWGGTMVGIPGWMVLIQKSNSVLLKINSLLDLSPATYYQRGNVVLHEFALSIKGSPAAPEPFSMGIIEKYTIENGRIKQIDEFYADTASFLDRLAVLGAIPPRNK
jgi:hypothetical protein